MNQNFQRVYSDLVEYDEGVGSDMRLKTIRGSSGDSQTAFRGSSSSIAGSRRRRLEYHVVLDSGQIKGGTNREKTPLDHHKHAIITKSDTALGPPSPPRQSFATAPSYTTDGAAFHYHLTALTTPSSSNYNLP
ncbi:hypothetical protein L2E82_02389 [Cichorium intybus]|uniref:Uncharacterized protein n=1 Tax=Cichorium intybus TaxID=13427 RepID=A0ACB9H1N4_CICIN|nr:hypothetical protein L2E82_02389 [Cichorium intybus]